MRRIGQIMVDMGFIELAEKATIFDSENCTETFQRNYKAAKAMCKKNGVSSSPTSSWSTCALAQASSPARQARFRLVLLSRGRMAFSSTRADAPTTSRRLVSYRALAPTSSAPCKQAARRTRALAGEHRASVLAHVHAGKGVLA